MVTLEKLDGKRVLITGGAGLIGSHVAELLAGAGPSEVLVFDNLSRGSFTNLSQTDASGRLTFVEGDIRDSEALAHALEGIDVLFHFAALRLPQCAENPRLALEVMVDGTFNVVEAAVAAGVGKVVAASSSTIYGMAGHFPTPEDHHFYSNRSIYGTAKVFSEGLLAAFRDMYGLDYLALRYFNVYGPRMDTDSAYTEVLIRWMDRIDRGLAPLIFGDGLQTVDFVYVGDAARASVMAAASGLSGEVYNIASGAETSLNQLAAALLRVMRSDLAPGHAPARTLNAVSRSMGSTRLARERLGFETEIGLDEGLRRLVTWWRNRPRNAEGPPPGGPTC